MVRTCVTWDVLLVLLNPLQDLTSCRAGARPGHPISGHFAWQRSIRFDAREPHHLAPLFGLFGDELAEVGGRARKCGGAPLGKPRLHLGIGKGRVDLRVELIDDFSWRGARRTDAGPEAR